MSKEKETPKEPVAAAIENAGGIGGWFLKTFGPLIEKVLADVLTKEIDSVKADITAKIDDKIDALESRFADELEPIEQTLGTIGQAFSGVNSLADAFGGVENKVDGVKGDLLSNLEQALGPFQNTVTQLEGVLGNLPHFPNIFGDQNRPG